MESIAEAIVLLAVFVQSMKSLDKDQSDSEYLAFVALEHMSVIMANSTVSERDAIRKVLIVRIAAAKSQEEKDSLKILANEFSVDLAS
jgi:hypothetical protein